MKLEFDYCVGIDWSGAKGEFHRGISVYCADADHTLPVKIHPPHSKGWSRQAVIDWLVTLAKQGRVLAGIDFAFAHPFCDQGAYYPGLETSPPTAQKLWQTIDSLNAQHPFLYGGGVWDDMQFSAYYNAPQKRRGERFSSRRRCTEEYARKTHTPSPTFNCVGPAGVGTGSLAGMRVLHHLKSQAHIWPFEKSYTHHNLCLVEIFPSFYFTRAGVKPVKQNHLQPAMMCKALSYFESDGVTDDFIAQGPDGDDADALISAAALRAGYRAVFSQHLPDAAYQEGWIFGVK